MNISPYIYHGYSNRYTFDIKLLNKICNNLKFTITNKITIVSVMNEECFNNSFLVKQCKTNNIDLIIPKYTFDIKKEEWKNTTKIISIIKTLKEIDTEYVLILDGRDTCILNNLDDDFIKYFEEFNCDILFNSQVFPFPLNQLKGNTDYLNAGVCLGKKESLLKFYSECSNHIEDVYLLKNGSPSEQYIIKKVVGYIDLKVKVDIENKLFTYNSNNIRKVADNL